MQNWLSWLPSPRSWVNAIALIFLVSSFQFGLGYLWFLIALLIRWSPQLGYLIWGFALLSPVGIIALLHHWLHRTLDEFFPESRLSETDPVQGITPSLMSWWEGLYGWLVSYLSMLLASILAGVIVSTTDFANLLALPWQRTPLSIGIPTLLQIILAAYLYQFEYAVQRHLIAIGAATRNQ